MSLFSQSQERNKEPANMLLGTDEGVFVCSHPDRANRIFSELNGIYFDYIKNREKTIEGRLNRKNDKWGMLKRGDIIIFKKKDESGKITDETISVYVTYIHFYSSFREMLLYEGIRRIFPGASSLEDCIELYKTWYSITDQYQNGVIGIQLEVIEE
jgi:ASC-1-like (ASCH) protein